MEQLQVSATHSVTLEALQGYFIDSHRAFQFPVHKYALRLSLSPSHNNDKVNHLILHYLDLCVVCFLKAIKSLLKLLVE